MAERIQRKRTKGWRKPEGAVYVGRGSWWGNPYRVSGETSPQEAEARAEVAEGRLSAIGLVIDDLHATGAISQDVADQLTSALEGEGTP